MLCFQSRKPDLYPHLYPRFNVGSRVALGASYQFVKTRGIQLPLDNTK